MTANNEPAADLTEKDRAFRAFVREENMWKVVFYVCTPLALYQSLNQIFKIFDSMMASHIGASSVSAVAYLSQLNLMLSALGGGLAVGASIKVSEAYGAGDFKLVKRRVSTLFALCGILGAGILLILVPFAPQFLRLARTPEEFITEGTTYFILDLFGIVLNFFNSVYIAIERARGNSQRILHLNMGVIVVKLALTALFVYVFHSGINMIAVATIISQLLMFSAAIYHLSRKGNAFSFGKVVVNSMCTIYSPLTVGALGISNNLGGITTNPQNGFQEGGSAIISQSLGAGLPKRALEAFRCILIINMAIGAVLMSLTLIFLGSISRLFSGGDPQFQQMICSIYQMEALGSIPLGINAAVMALLYGFGKTRISLIINFSRVFIFRVPVLWGLQQFTDLGDISAGIVMAVSNIATGVLAVIVGWITIRQIKKQYGI